MRASRWSEPLRRGLAKASDWSSGAKGIVIDVKTGAGAFLPKLDDSRKLAQSLVAIGTRLDRKMAALITDMSQPLGYMVGNALEVREALDTLEVIYSFLV